jgi:heat shock protein HslJ
VTVTALFDGKTLSGESGCNAYHAPYTVHGRSMTIGKNVATTLRACPPGPTAVERSYLQRLRRVTTFRISGKTLSLSGRANRVLLTYRASVGAEAVVGRWEVTGYYTGTAISSVVPNSTITAEFDGTTISGDGGCNMYSGPYQVSGSTISIGPLNSTLRACADEAVNTQERQYLTALELASSFSVAGSRLDLLRDDGGIAVSFVPATK